MKNDKELYGDNYSPNDNNRQGQKNSKRPSPIMAVSIGLIFILFSGGYYPPFKTVHPPPQPIAIASLIIGIMFLLVGFVYELHKTIQRIVDDRIENKKKK